jgi:hypothetical protein
VVVAEEPEPFLSVLIITASELPGCLGAPWVCHEMACATHDVCISDRCLCAALLQVYTYPAGAVVYSFGWARYQATYIYITVGEQEYRPVFTRNGQELEDMNWRCHHGH